MYAIRSYYAKTAFVLARSEKGADAVLSDDEEVKIIQKLVKQRMEAASIYKENNRPDLYEKEVAEASVLEKYLPARLSDEELSVKLKEIIVRLGAKSQADIV